MDRAELERLDRESLVTRAQAAGIRRARLLTRPELVDELLRLDPAVDEAQLKRTRGFFGLARDLLSRVVERGLHLPDAADRLRAALGNPLPQVPRPEPQAVPTLTLAEIYAAQGHKQRAIDTLRRVLEDEPEHGAARGLLEKLEAASYVPPPPPLPPEDDARDEIGSNLGSGGAEAVAEPPESGPSTVSAPVEAEVEEEAEAQVPDVADDEPATQRMDVPAAVVAPLPPATPARAASPRSETFADLDEAPTIRRDEGLTPSPSAPVPTPKVIGVRRPPDDGPDACVAIPLPSSLFVSWRLSSRTLKRLQDEPAFFFVRAVILQASWNGPQEETRDLACDPAAGELLVRDLPNRAVVRIAVGVLDGGEFVPFAHSPLFEKRPDGIRTKLVRWTLEGYESIAADDPGRGLLLRALKQLGRATERAGIVTGAIELDGGR